MTRRIRGIPWAAIPLVLILLLAACGDEEGFGNDGSSSDRSGSPTSVVETAATPAIEPTAAVTFEATETAEPLASPTESDGVADDEEFPDGDIPQSYGMSIEEAQALVPFDLVLPNPLPAELTFVGAEVASDDDSAAGDPDITLSYRVGDADVFPSIILAESVEPLDFASDLGTNAVMVVDAMLMFGDTPVTHRTIVSQGCYAITLYDWERDGLYFASASFASRPVFGATSSQDDDALVLRLIAAMTDADVPVTATPAATTDETLAPNGLGEYCDITIDQARAVASFPIVAPDDVSAPFVLSNVQLQHGFEYTTYSSEEEEATAEALRNGEQGDPGQLALTYFIDGSIGFTQAILTQSTNIDLHESSPLAGYEDLQSPEAETLKVEGVDVTRVSFDVDSGEKTYSSTAEPDATTVAGGPRDIWYGWSIGDTYFLLNATIAAEDAQLVTDENIEALIADFITTE